MSSSGFPFPKQTMSTNDYSPPETYYKQPTEPVPIITHQPEPQQYPPRHLPARRPPGTPSMRTPIQAQGSNVYEQGAAPAVERRPIDSVHATPTKTLGQRKPSRYGTAQKRYRETSSESEAEEPHNTRPPTRRPLPNPRTGSYPPTDYSLPPPTTEFRQNPRRLSSGSASDSGHGRGKPRGLNFHEAREYMKSGRPVRPESWHAGQTSTTENVPIHFNSAPASPRVKVTGVGRPPTPPMPSPASTERINNRIGWALFLNSGVKNHLVATLGELIGTTMFLFFAFAGTQVANVNTPSSSQNPSTTTTGGATGWNLNKLLYVSFSFGFSLMANVWIFFRISGGLFNPAVTLALLLTGAITFVRALFLFFAQIVGSIAATALIVGLFPAPADVRTTLHEGLSLPRGLLIEAFLTAELVFTILMLAKEKHRATFIAPIGIGLSLFIAELVGVHWTGGSLNPARSIGPNIVTNTWDPTHWIYWAGPLLGSLLATAFYTLIKALEYEMANPGQDAPDADDEDSKQQHLLARQHEVRRRLMEALGYDTRLSGEYDPERLQSLGCIQLGYQKPGLGLYPMAAAGWGGVENTLGERMAMREGRREKGGGRY